MLLQTNSYIVPKEKRAEHSRLIRRFRQTLLRLGCDHFEVYEQVGSNWSNSESAGRYVQILRFLDRKHQLAVQSAERTDPTAQAVIADFCELINFPYQQQQGLFAVGFYTSVLPVAPKRGARGELVSTVEHEVIDDPEAEKPYPGSSDGPPLEEGALGETGEEPLAESMADQPLAEESAEHFDEPLEEHHEPLETGHEALGATAKHRPEMIGTDLVEELPVEAAAAALPEEIAAEPGHPGSAPHIAGAEAHTESTDDFMDLVGGDLAAEPLDEDDAANGFLAVDFGDEMETGGHLNGVQPTHPQPAEHHESK